MKIFCYSTLVVVVLVISIFNLILFFFFGCIFGDESDVTPGDKKLHDHWINTRVTPMLAKHFI